MTWIAAILGLSSFSFLLIYISFQIKEKGLDGLKGLLFLVGVLNVFLLPGMLYLLTLHPDAIANTTGVFLAYFISHSIVLIAVIWIYSYFLVTRAMERTT